MTAGHEHDGLPVVDVTVYLSETLSVVADGCALEITVGSARLTVCPQDMAPSAAEADSFERLADVVLEVRGALRDAYQGPA